MSGPAMIRDLPVADVDILGDEDGAQTIFANAMLAEMRGLHRATADLLGELVERVKKLEDGGGPQVEAAA